jgi:hypothetical protein
MDCEINANLNQYFPYKGWTNKIMNQFSTTLLFFNEWSKTNYLTNTTQFQESIIFAPGCALMSLLSKAYTH